MTRLERPLATVAVTPSRRGTGLPAAIRGSESPGEGRWGVLRAGERAGRPPFPHPFPPRPPQPAPRER